MPARGLRLGCFAAVATALAALSHVLGGGDAPTVGTAAAAASVPVLAGLWLSHRRRSFGSILPVLAVVQVVLHHLFMAGTADLRMPAPMPMAGAVPAMDPASAAFPPLAMLIWHAVAVALTAAVLAGGEQALWHLVHWLRLVPVVPEVGRYRRPVGPSLVPAAPLVPAGRFRVLSGLSRRGPPVLPA